MSLPAPGMPLGSPHFHFESIDSTMREAAERAAAGAKEGTLVTADRQTAGRGRLGRSWLSTPGEGVYFSVVLRPQTPAARAPILTLACGLGVSRALGETCGITCDIRWPNDVMLGGRKTAGILVDMVGDAGQTEFVIAGVGINVNHEEFPPELASTATSLRLATGCEWARDIVLAAALRRIEQYYEMFRERGAAPIREAFERTSSWARGKAVIVENVGAELRGVTAGLDESGVLLLRDESGAIRPVVAGSVRALEEED